MTIGRRVLVSRAIAAVGLAAATAAAGGCRSRVPRTAETDTASTLPGAFHRDGVAIGFQSPESAVYDSTRDAWYVSNIVGDPGARDHEGFISRLRGDGSLDSLQFIRSGAPGVSLDAPKGLALHGDTLWVADLDQLRAFDAASGRPLATIDLRPLHASFLNAVAVGADGRLYVTDTQANAIFVVGPNHAPALAVHDTAMEGPNGIAWDAGRQRFLIVALNGTAITSWAPGDPRVALVTRGVGQFDGNCVLPDGRALVSSWADSSLFILTGDSLTRAIAGGLPGPADLHVNARTMRVAIPLLPMNRVVFFDVPPAGRPVQTVP